MAIQKFTLDDKLILATRPVPLFAGTTQEIDFTITDGTITGSGQLLFTVVKADGNVTKTINVTNGELASSWISKVNTAFYQQLGALWYLSTGGSHIYLRATAPRAHDGTLNMTVTAAGGATMGAPGLGTVLTNTAVTTGAIPTGIGTKQSKTFSLIGGVIATGGRFRLTISHALGTYSVTANVTAGELLVPWLQRLVAASGGFPYYRVVYNTSGGVKLVVEARDAAANDPTLTVTLTAELGATFTYPDVATFMTNVVSVAGVAPNATVGKFIGQQALVYTSNDLAGGIMRNYCDIWTCTNLNPQVWTPPSHLTVDRVTGLLRRFILTNGVHSTELAYP